MFVKLTKEWQNYKKGAVVSVGDYTGDQLIKSKMAEKAKEEKKKASK